MNLVILSNHPIETLVLWVNQMFGPIVNKEVVLPDHSKPQLPFTASNLGQLVRMKPIKDKHILEVTWVLPYCELETKSKPIKYFSHLFGHESQNSLLGWLKDRSLAMSLSSDFQHEIGVFTYLCVAIVLTEKGLEEVDTVI
jgi:insulysin